jgi:hypothetical protein
MVSLAFQRTTKPSSLPLNRKYSYLSITYPMFSRANEVLDDWQWTLCSDLFFAHCHVQMYQVSWHAGSNLHQFLEWSASHSKVVPRQATLLLPISVNVQISVFSTNFHLSSVWHQWNKKCSTFVHILDGIIIIWWKFGQFGWKYWQ